MADNKDKIKKELFETSVIVQDAFRSISDNIGEMFKDALGVTETFSKSLEKDITKSLSSLAKTTTLLEGNYNKISKGEINRRDILKQIEDRTLKIKSIETSIEIAKRNQVSIADDLVKELNEAIQAEEILKIKLLEQADAADKINKKIGVTGALLKGIGRIPIIGNLIDTKAALEAAAATADKGGTKFAAMGSALKSVGKDLLGAFTDPLVTIGLFVKAFKLLVELGFKADTQITNLSKSMAISKEQATGVRDRFVEIQNSAENLFETTENLVNAQLELADAFGATQGFSERQVRDQVLLTKQIKLTAEEAVGVQKLAMANGMTAEQVTKSVIKQTATLAKQTGIQLDNKKVLGEVAKISGQLRLQYQNNPELIAKAVVQAQKLGITLEQAKKSSESLLNFEQSISSELEAELLTGKDLNLEKARSYALNHDIAGLTQEIANQGITQEKFATMNVIQQEAMAKSLGMSADEMGDMLYKGKVLNKVGGDTLKNLRERAKVSGDINLQNKVAALEQGILNGKSLEEAEKSTSAQEKFNQSLEQAKEIFSDFVDGGFLDLLADAIKSFADMILSTEDKEKAAAKRGKEMKNSEEYKKYTPEQQKYIDEQQKIVEENQVGIGGKFISSLSPDFMGMDYYGDVEKYGKSASEKLSQIKSKGFEGKTTNINAKDFVIKTLPEDTVVAAGGTSLGNSKEMIQLLTEQNQLLAGILNKEGTIVLNGTKMGTAMAVGSYRTQ